MTVSVSTRLSQLYVGNNVNKNFSFTFRVFNQEGENGISIRLKTVGGFTTIDKSLYTVILNEDNLGGQIEFKTPPSPIEYFYIAGTTPTDQQLDITNYDNFYPDAIELALDKLTAILQEWSTLLTQETQARQIRDNELEQYVKDYVDSVLQINNPSAISSILADIVKTNIAGIAYNQQQFNEFLLDYINTRYPDINEFMEQAQQQIDDLALQLQQQISDDIALAVSHIEQGFVKTFPNTAELQAFTPPFSPYFAKAMDTRKIWRWDQTSAPGVIPITGVWTDTGLSDLDQAKGYIDAKVIFDTSDKILSIRDTAEKLIVLLHQSGDLYLPNITKSVQQFLNFLDNEIKNVGSRVEYDDANSSIKVIDANGGVLAALSVFGTLHVHDVATKNGSVERRLANLETNAVSDIKSEMLKSTDHAIAARDASALLNNSMLFSLEELSVAYVFASSICRLSKYEYIIFCEGRVGGDFDPAKLFMRKVTINADYSLSLGPVQIAVDSGGTGDSAYSILNACSIKVSTGTNAGRVYLYYLKRFYNTHIDEAYYIYSDDNCATWSNPVDMSPFIPNFATWKIVAIGPGKAIQLKHGDHAGRIILPCWHGDQNYPGSQAGLKSFILYSDDGGASYSVGAESMYAGSNECQVAELKQGGFALLTRDSSQQKAIEYSYDGGSTLIEPRKLSEITTTRVQSGFLQCENSFELSVPKLIVSTPSKSGAREDIGLWVSYDEKTFQFWKQVSTGLSSYSDLMPIDESHLLVTYSAGRADQNRDIKAVVLNLKSILLGA